MQTRVLIFALLWASCGYRERSVCQTYLSCVDLAGGDWERVGAHEQYGAGGACWEDPTRRCAAECFEAVRQVPAENDPQGVCVVVYTPDLLTDVVFADLFVESYCRRASECGVECAIPIPLPDGADPPSCDFDLPAAQECLRDRFSWPCSDVDVDVPAACERACTPIAP